MDATYGQVVSLAEEIELHVPVTNRRSEMRRRPWEVRWLRSARLKYGPIVDIVDISPNGIRIRSHRELSPNDTIVFELEVSNQHQYGPPRCAQGGQRVCSRPTRARRLDRRGSTRRWIQWRPGWRVVKGGNSQGGGGGQTKGNQGGGSTVKQDPIRLP